MEEGPEKPAMLEGSEEAMCAVDSFHHDHDIEEESGDDI
jgi:hypothetical protein